jgi:hypothetical protein
MKITALALFVCLASSSGALAQNVTTLTLATNDLVYDRVSGKLFASVPASAGANGNSIAVIDPASAVVERYLQVGASPNKLALSDDGQYLYVGLDGANSVRRVDTRTLEPGPQFGLGSSSWGAYVASDLAVLPGAPLSVAVARKDAGPSGIFSVAVYDDGWPRSKTTAGYDSVSALTFSANSSRLYGLYSGSLCRLTIDASGVTADSSVLFLKASSAAFAGGLLYGNDGTIGDPERLTREGVLAGVESVVFGHMSDVVLDLDRSRIVGATTDGLIVAYDSQTLRPVWSVDTKTGNTATLVSCGGTVYATRTTDGKVLVIDTAGTQPLHVAVRGTGNGRVTSTPAGISCGAWNSGAYVNADCDRLFPDTATVVLSAVAATGSRFVGWTGGPACASGVVPMTTEATCTATFEQTAPMSGVLQVPIASRDLAYSPLTGKVYVSVPGWAPGLGNTVTEIDPATGAIERSAWVGSEPALLAISDDGRYLYASLYGSFSIRQIDLSDFSVGPVVSPGRSVAGQWYLAKSLAVQPGSPHVIAVGRGVDGYSGMYGVAVFDHGVQRTDVASGDFSDVVFGAAPSALYGYDSLRFVRLSVGPSGVSLVDTPGYSDGAVRPVFTGGVLHIGDLAIDPVTPAILGTFPTAFGSSGLNTVAVDPAARVRYAIPRGTSGDPALQAFDTETLRPLWQAGTAVVGMARALTVAGDGRLAFRSDHGQVFLVNLAWGRALAVMKGGTGGGSIASTPAGIACGSTCGAPMASGSTVTLTATANADSIFVRWEGDEDCVDGVVTMSGARTCTAVFAELNHGRGMQLPIDATALAYSPATGKIYAAVPGRAVGLGNTITVVDPATGAVGPSLWIGSEPGSLAVSSDGLTLYVSTPGSASVRPLDLITLTPRPAFRLGLDQFGDPNRPRALAAVPGDPASLAVSRNGDTAIYSNGVARSAVATRAPEALAFSDSGSRLYGRLSGYLVRNDVGPSGVTDVDMTYLSGMSYGPNLSFDHGRLYVDNGGVIDPEAKTQVGTFPLGTPGSGSLVAPDVGRGVVSFVEHRSGGYAIRGYDPATLARLSSVDLLGATGTASCLIGAGPGRFAFVTDAGQVIVFAQDAVASHTLVIAAQGPAGAIATSVDVSPADLDGRAGGTTPFTRTFLSGTAVTLTAPAAVGNFVFRAWGTTGPLPILTTIVDLGGTKTANYGYRPPVLTGVAPRVGLVEGGTKVTLTGSEFRGGARLWVDSSVVVSATVLDSGTATAVMPYHPSAVVSLSFQNPDGQLSTLASAFAYRGMLSFTDDPLTPGVTPVKRTHLTELRAAIDNVRVQYGLAPFAWTESISPRVTRIKAVHLADLRGALSAAYVAAGRDAPVFAEPDVAAGVTLVTAAHLMEIRAAIAAIW